MLISRQKIGATAPAIAVAAVLLVTRLASRSGGIPNGRCQDR